MSRTLLSLILRNKKENLSFLAGLIVISVIYSISYMKVSYVKFFGEKCIADAFRFINRCDFIAYIIIPFMLYYAFITRDEYDVMYIVKRKSKKEIWLLGLLNDIKIALVYSIILFVIESVIARCLWGNVELINWSSYMSCYSIASHGEISDIGISLVVLKVFLLFCTKITVGLFFSRFVVWITNIRLLSIIVVVFSAVFDTWAAIVIKPVFWGRFLYNINDWGTNTLLSYRCVYWVMIIAVIIVIAGWMYSEHKEFIDNEHV